MSEKNKKSGNDLADISHDLFAVRMEKLNRLREAGEDPFRANWNQTHTSKDCAEIMAPAIAAAKAAGTDIHEIPSPAEEVSVAGRIIAIRVMGKASFMKILDRDGIQQIYLTRDILGEERYNQHFKKMIDIGDFVGVRGELFVTKTGEVTVRAREYALVSKALRPLPEKWHGITNEEQVSRQRYLDLIANPESKKRLMQRTQIIAETRKFLWAKGFVEVETPVLHPIAGGAAARPFVTHFNALDCEFYMRIALELHLKRCLIGGIERVFEIGRVFRNEGIDRRHNPEFTMMEIYQAYSDYKGMMKLIRELVLHLCKTVIGATEITRYDGQKIDLGGEWRVVDYKDLVRERTGRSDWFDLSKEEKIAECRRMADEIRAREKAAAEARGEELKNKDLMVPDPRDDWEDYEVTNEVYGKIIEPTLIQPTFVTHIMKELCPLAKINEKDPGVIDVFELCINGQEIAPAYSEQNDPITQRRMFELQAGEEQQKVDQDFLVAMEHGMPPAGGMGVGMDRLCMLLTGCANIRETILFPTLKPDLVSGPQAAETKPE
ncbi:MAG: lysine--tRNA ligase [Opitutae bacterium]|nr:lysine--tRNA ligase [Opitutae bacterium]